MCAAKLQLEENNYRIVRRPVAKFFPIFIKKNENLNSSSDI